MKKLALAIASLSLAAAPVFACPHADKEEAKEAPKTAENGKKDAAPKAEKAKEAPKADQKVAEKKTAEKVSAR